MPAENDLKQEVFSSSGERGIKYYQEIKERLLSSGPRALSSEELLALVLGGSKNKTASIVASKLLEKYDGLNQLSKLNPAVLCKDSVAGIDGGAKMVAAFELGIRCRENATKLLTVQGPDDLTSLLYAQMYGLDREHFIVLYLNTRHEVIGRETVSIGCLNASIVHPREVFRGAIYRGAAAIIVAHNHPSGCSLPSKEDVILTARLVECGKLIGIELLDHLVVGDGNYTSLRQYDWPNVLDASEYSSTCDEG